jgi:hypothetical protein
MNIPTAKEFIISTELVVKFDNTQGCILEEELPSLFIEFAKLHVQAALKAADDNADVTVIDVDMTGTIWGVDSETILNAYPLENIK